MKPEQRFGFEENMPEPIRVLFVELAGDVVQLHHIWEFMSELFGKPVNVSLLNKTATEAGGLIGRAFEDSMIMAVCRLSDKLWTGQDNLTLERLTKACSEIPGLEQLCKDFYTTTSPFRAHRNKRINHDDLGTAIKPHENPLPGISKSRVEEMLKLASRILKTVHGRYSRAELAVVPPIHVGGERPDLLDKKRLRSGAENTRAESWRFIVSRNIPPRSYGGRQPRRGRRARRKTTFVIAPFYRLFVH